MIRTVPRFPAYYVDLYGTVRTWGTHVKVYPHLRNGYARVRLTDNGIRRWVPVHTIVLEAWLGPRPSPRHHGAHGAGGQLDNRLENLRWALPEENEADKRRCGTVTGGVPGTRPLSKRQVKRILARAVRGDSFSNIAKDYRVHRHTVSRIARGLRHPGVQV